MFEQFSERAKRVIFLTREIASTKGNTAFIEPCYLLYGLVREDQGEMAARMPNVVRIGNSELRPAHSFFSAETAGGNLGQHRAQLAAENGTDPVLKRHGTIRCT